MPTEKKKKNTTTHAQTLQSHISPHIWYAIKYFIKKIPKTKQKKQKKPHPNKMTPQNP